MRYFLFLAISILMGLTVQAQMTTIKGTLIDSADKRNVQNAVVMLFNQQDSLLVDFARADSKGHFSLSSPDTAKLVLLVTHPYFADFNDRLTPNGRSTIDMGFINMLSKSKLLEEVIVKSGSPIRIKGDTTIYTADSFKVREGANVEELLRKFPGVQVDRNGQITALGEKVERFLVDGEEFFGSDPGIATKNLKADIVKEVQVYKGKSDQAAFTGIDDGQSKQTMNLVLKEDKKKGFFGKIELGGGLKNKSFVGDQNKFNNALMFNAFKAKRKFSAYGIMSNTGKLNLDWQDAGKYGGGEGNSMMTDDGGIMIIMGGDYNSSSGIPTNWNGGVHYSNKFNEDKQSLNTGYKFTKINSPGETNTYARNFLADSTWLNYSNNKSTNSNIKQNANIIFETKIDSMNTVKLTVNGSLNNTNSKSKYYNENRNLDSSFINTNERYGSGTSDNSNLTSNLLWMHKFKKLYRTLSINTGYVNGQSNGNRLMYSKLNFYKNGLVDSASIIDQNTLTKSNNNALNSKIAYTEPLAKDFYMELNYAFGLNNNKNDRSVMANDGTGMYDNVIDSLSNSYAFNSLSNAPGFNLRLNKKKFSFSVGTSAAFTNYEQKNISKKITRSYDFVNHNPRANFSYRMGPSQSMQFRYNGNSQSPSLDQLQPIPDNSDPLNISIGNPNLNPSFNHNFNIFYNSFKTLKERGIWGYLSYGFTQNAFVQFSEFDKGIRRYYTVNTNGVANLNSNISYDFKIRSIGLRLGLGGGYNYGRNIDFVTNFVSGKWTTLKNITNSSGYAFNLDINKSVDGKFEIGLRPSVSYNQTVATVSKNANAKYWSSSLSFWGNVQLPGNVELRMDLDGNYKQKDPRFPANNNFTIWNSFVTKKFYKDQFEARLSVYDILNQNKGYSRNFDSYSFTETYQNTLQRFWLLSFVWNITKNSMGTSAAK